MKSIALFFAAITIFVNVVQAEPLAPELQTLQDQLPGKLINDPRRLDWDLYGQNKGAASRPIKNADVQGGAALQITVPNKGATLYEIGLNVPLTASITKGATYVVSFYARTISSETPEGTGVVGVRFQQNAAPYSGFGDTKLDIGKEWHLYEVSGQANANVPKDQAIVSFQLSGAKQTIQLGQTVVQEGATSILKPSAKTAPQKCDVTTPVLPPTLVGKGPVLTTIDTQNWDAFGTGETHKRVIACGVPGDTAIEYSIATKGVNPYDIGVNIPLIDAVKQGDVLIVGLLARTIKAETSDGMGLVTLRLQQDAPPYTGFGDHVIPFGPAWQLKRFMVIADRDLAKGQGALALHLAGAKQVIQLGRAYVVHTTRDK